MGRFSIHRIFRVCVVVRADERNFLDEHTMCVTRTINYKLCFFFFRWLPLINVVRDFYKKRRCTLQCRAYSLHPCDVRKRFENCFHSAADKNYMRRVLIALSLSLSPPCSHCIHLRLSSWNEQPTHLFGLCVRYCVIALTSYPLWNLSSTTTNRRRLLLVLHLIGLLLRRMKSSTCVLVSYSVFSPL